MDTPKEKSTNKGYMITNCLTNVISTYCMFKFEEKVMTHLGLLIKVLILGLLTFHINSVNVIRAKYCWDREIRTHKHK